MAKKTQEPEQIDLFPSDPMIRGLAVNRFEVKDGTVIGSLNGATLSTDVAELTVECWQKAVAEWLVGLCRNNGTLIQSLIDEQREILQRREEEMRLTQEAFNRVKNFPQAKELA